MSKCPACGQELPGPDRMRTTWPQSQNHHLNGHIQQICQETGDDFEDMKRNIKQRAIKRGYPFKTNSFGEVVAKRERDATVQECALLIDEVHEVAAFLEIRLREDA